MNNPEEEEGGGTSTCEHHYVFRGVVYEEGDRLRDHPSGRAVTYYNDYYCDRCLKHRYEYLSSGTSFKIEHDASPKPRAA